MRRKTSHQQQETPEPVRLRSNGSAWTTSFSNAADGCDVAKLSGIYGTRHTTKFTVPVNFVTHWRGTEDRGFVVPRWRHELRRHYGKGAKSTHGTALQPSQGVACSDPGSRDPVSSNGEQKNSDSTWAPLNLTDRLGGDHSHPLNGLIRLMARPGLWIAAYAKLSRNPGSLTRGTTTSTIDGTSLATLDALRVRVRTGSYPWGSIRRVWIPKPGRAERRPLGIPDFQDRLVQEVLRHVLDAIYEPRFLDCSHGFRARRGQHSCIRYVRAWFPGTTWYIEGDISRCFDRIDHDVLLALLRRRVRDKRFLGLIAGGLKARVIDTKVTLTSDVGTPQGGVVSPLLSNIYLHELDRYMTRVIRVVNRGKRRRVNPAYHRLTNVAYRARNRGDYARAAAVGKQLRRLPSKDPMDAGYRRVRYVRYADDFLIGVSGPLALAHRIRDGLGRFLKARLKLDLNRDKTHITHHEHRVPWLGFLISTAPRPSGGKARLGGRTIRQRIPPLGVKVYVDRRAVVRRLAEKGYCDRSGTPTPNWREALQPPQSYSVDRGARLLRGLNSYYRVANDRRAVTHRLMMIIRGSLAKTFAAKFKLGTVKRVLALAGKDLSAPLRSKRPAIGNTDARQMADAVGAGGRLVVRTVRLPYTLAKDVAKPDLGHSFDGRGTGPHRDPYVILRSRAERAHSALSGVCSACQHTDGVEMHHVRGLKDLRGRTLSERIMIAVNRKQIPLCRPCHLKAHGLRSHIKTRS
jgi:group II intron reverse transcriptase/maturase